MLIPERIPGLKWVTTFWAILFLVWFVLEGNLSLALVLGGMSALVLSAQLGQRFLGGRHFSGITWLILSSFLGLMFSFLMIGLIFLLMIIKTGVHAHGPEFTSEEISWVVGQTPVWAISGMIAGLGLGLLSLALANQQS